MQSRGSKERAFRARIVKALRDEGAQHAALVESEQDYRRRRLVKAFEMLAGPTFNDLLEWLAQHQPHARRKGSRPHERGKASPEEHACALARHIGAFEPLTEWEVRAKRERDTTLDAIAGRAEELARLIEIERPPLSPAWFLAGSIAPTGMVSLETWKAVQEQSIEGILHRLARSARALKRNRSRISRPTVGAPGAPLARALATEIVAWFRRNYTTNVPFELVADLLHATARELHGVETEMTGEQIRQLLKERKKPEGRSRRGSE